MYNFQWTVAPTHRFSNRVPLGTVGPRWFAGLVLLVWFQNEANPQSLATVFIIIFVFPSPRPLPCINKKFMNSDGHQMAWTVRSARVYRIQRSKSIKLNTDSRVVPWQLEEKYISYHSPTIKNDITRSDACKRGRNSVKSSDVGRQKVPCTS